ncbi:DUF6279 family lipoprotein [Candidatus Skiveiella danica]|uniref:DUF6279 family lipoprotein n=1 Tax=Candidatus Skiveiella danica TaxID=3386177 RepID=UPI001D95C6C2|nr:hypothetical protein [Betaproteobacteria bacterium]
MKLVSWFLRIIGLCVAGLALASCSLVKLGYGQLPDLTYWWIDSYIDVTDAQTPRLRRELDELAQWHRTQELPKLALLLGKARQLAPGPISPAQACALFEDGRERFNAVTARTESLVLWLAPSLGPAQIDHLAAKYAKINKEWDDWLQGTPADQLKHRVKKATERFEMLYGQPGRGADQPAAHRAGRRQLQRPHAAQRAPAPAGRHPSDPAPGECRQPAARGRPRVAQRVVDSPHNPARAGRKSLCRNHAAGKLRPGLAPAQQHQRHPARPRRADPARL